MRNPAAPARRSSAGVTLVEAAIVVTVLATLLALAIPSFLQTRTLHTLEGVAGNFAGDVLYVRSEAVARGQSVRIGFATTAGGSCYVLHTGPAGACACGEGGQAACAAGASELKTVFVPSSTGVRVQSNVASMLFDTVHGTTSPGGTVRIVAGDGRAIYEIVNIMGRPRACSPGAAVRGYRAC